MQRHLIFTSGRSGSNYLSSTLRLSPECVNYGEVLGEWATSYKLLGKYYCDNNKANNYLDVVYSNQYYFMIRHLYYAFVRLRNKEGSQYKSYKKVKTIGIKEFLFTIENHHCADYFGKDTDLKVIYLHRDNILQRYVSVMFMLETGISYTYNEVDAKPVILDIENLIMQLTVLEQESIKEKVFISGLATKHVLDIEYQSYFKSSETIEEWNNTMFDFLEIAPVKMVSKHKKILSNTLKDAVGNYQEVIDVLQGTRFERFIY
jgi:hypothetical protein